MSTIAAHSTLALLPGPDATAHHRNGCRCPGCRQRDRMTARELLARCDRAAALELAGKDWRDYRPDVAAQLLADGLQRTAGTLPLLTDAQHSLTAYCDRAKVLRRSRERELARDDRAAQLAADAHALSRDALAPETELALRAEERAQLQRDATDTRTETAARAARAAAQLNARGDSNVYALLYRELRLSQGLTDARIARELSSTAGALRVKASRGAAKLAQLTDPVTMLAQLTRGARYRWQWQDSRTMRSTHSRTSVPVALRVELQGLDYASEDSSRAAGVGRCSTAGGKLTRRMHAQRAYRRAEPGPVRTAKLQRTRAERERAQRTARKARADRAARTAARDALRTAQLAATRATANASGAAALRKHASGKDNRRAGTRATDNR